MAAEKNEEVYRMLMRGVGRKRQQSSSVNGGIENQYIAPAQQYVPALDFFGEGERKFLGLRPSETCSGSGDELADRHSRCTSDSPSPSKGKRRRECDG